MAKGGLFNSHRGPHMYCCPIAHRPAKVGDPGEVPGQVLHPKDNENNGLNTGRRGAGNKRKKSKSPTTAGRGVKGTST